MIGGEGHTVPERVGPCGADNATNPELVWLPCAQLGSQLGGAPNQKKTIVASVSQQPKWLSVDWYYELLSHRNLGTIYELSLIHI